MISYYKFIIQYKGTNYLGWQVQPETYGKTVQGELNKALTIISKDKVQTMGAGRTDSGVHALGQVVKAAIALQIEPEKLLKALNANLPDDIRVISADHSSLEFHPTVDAVSKEYHYRFTSSRNVSVFQLDLIANQTFDLDLALMRRACELLIGEHDFTNYFCEGTEVLSKVRTILECELLTVSQENSLLLPDHYLFRIIGNGFLKQMVRLLMGAIWNVGRGKISLEEFQSSLTSQKTPRMGVVAPPQGLYMVRVNY